MTYNNGALTLPFKNIKARLDSHKTSGQILASVKRINVGSRPLTNTQDAIPLISIEMLSATSKSMMTANSAGENTVALPIQIRVADNKLRSTDGKNEYAENVLFDDAGNGVLPLIENIIYALSYDTSGNWLPCLGLQLDIMPQYNVYNDSHEAFNEMVITFSIEERYSYSLIKGSTS